MSKPLKIVHCFRSPVGGIFRHVRDLIEVQVALGHEVGILCDNNTGGDYEEALFDTLSPSLKLGLHRIPMDRRIGPSDIVALWRAYRTIGRLNPDVLHSHGAKGGAYARIIGGILKMTGSKVARLYCPHGGSIHFDANSLKGRVYFMLERLLERSTDRLIFVSNYEKQGYIDKIGQPRCGVSLVYNGLKDYEFQPVATEPDGADFLYIGMMRDLKGPDLFIKALPIIEKQLGRKVTAHMVGDGPDTERYVQSVHDMGLDDRITFHPPMPAREAFAKAKIVVVPSRAESMPYIVLETIAAAKPLITTNVGGIPEIYEDAIARLVEPGSASALAHAMAAQLDNPDAIEDAIQFARKIRGRFSVLTMAEAVNAAYQATINQ
jgi:glycosyltransferase involved in cell wall biosynthesis